MLVAKRDYHSIDLTLSFHNVFIKEKLNNAADIYCYVTPRLLVLLVQIKVTGDPTCNFADGATQLAHT